MHATRGATGRYRGMPRDSRLVEPERPHHVVLRGNNRRRLFSFASDYLRLLVYLGVALEPGQCRLHAIVMMSNHVHLLLTPQSAQALADFVKALSQRYAQYRNRTRGGSGKLFEERYFSCPIEDDNHYGCTLAYIDDNPRRAGIVLHPSDYRWSSYHVYVGGREPWKAGFADLITPASWYLDLGASTAARAASYVDWVEDCHTRARRPLHADKIDQLERASVRSHRRLRRPDGSSAA